MIKSTPATASKTPPKNASTPVKSYSTSPKKGYKEKKLDHKIINVTYPDKHCLVGHLTISMMPRISSRDLSNRDVKVTKFVA
jgi:hypothetical protein